VFSQDQVVAVASSLSAMYTSTPSEYTIVSGIPSPAYLIVKSASKTLASKPEASILAFSFSVQLSAPILF